MLAIASQQVLGFTDREVVSRCIVESEAEAVVPLRRFKKQLRKCDLLHRDPLHSAQPACVLVWALHDELRSLSASVVVSQAPMVGFISAMSD